VSNSWDKVSAVNWSKEGHHGSVRVPPPPHFPRLQTWFLEAIGKICQMLACCSAPDGKGSLSISETFH
jgi:hypothetical protein